MDCGADEMTVVVQGMANRDGDSELGVWDYDGTCDVFLPLMDATENTITDMLLTETMLMAQVRMLVQVMLTLLRMVTLMNMLLNGNDDDYDAAKTTVLMTMVISSRCPFRSEFEQHLENFC